MNARLFTLSPLALLALMTLAPAYGDDRVPDANEVQNERVVYIAEGGIGDGAEDVIVEFGGHRNAFDW